MKVKDLKEYMSSIPEELDDFDVVYSEVSILDESDGTWARKDMPLDNIMVDQDTGEMLLAKHGTIETIDKLVASDG